MREFRYLRIARACILEMNHSDAMNRISDDIEPMYTRWHYLFLVSSFDKLMQTDERITNLIPEAHLYIFEYTFEKYISWNIWIM